MTTEIANKFLKTVREALGHPPDFRRTPPPDLFADAASLESRRLQAGIGRRSSAEKLKLLDILKNAAEPLNMKVVAVDTIEDATMTRQDAAAVLLTCAALENALEEITHDRGGDDDDAAQQPEREG